MLYPWSLWLFSSVETVLFQSVHSTCHSHCQKLSYLLPTGVYMDTQIQWKGWFYGFKIREHLKYAEVKFKVILLIATQNISFPSCISTHSCMECWCLCVKGYTHWVKDHLYVCAFSLTSSCLCFKISYDAYKYDSFF